MLKVRLQGTTNDIKWFRKLLERNRKVKLLSFSEPYCWGEIRVRYSFESERLFVVIIGQQNIYIRR